MSQENVELARRTYEAFNRRDLDAVLNVFHPEVEILSRRSPMRPSTAAMKR